jgi:ligand-binding sensor domain-containing protein/signal transduction histidine kinase
MPRSGCIIRFLFFMSLQAGALAAYSQKQLMKFDHLGTNQGLSQSNVTCILKDSRGFMWFGTRDGLNKYDGYGFKVYRNIASDQTSISSNYITSIIEDRNGDLWIATYEGLNRFVRQTGRFVRYHYDKGRSGVLSTNVINSLLQDNDGNVWIGTDGRGMDILNPATGQFVNYAHQSKDLNSLSDNDVTDIFQDSRNRIWVSTFKGGLNLFDRKSRSFTHFRHNEKDSNSLSCDIICKVFEDSRHRLWVGTRGGGLELLDPDQKTFHHYKNDPHNGNSLTFNIVMSICQDDNAKLWVGTENGGISVLDPEKGIFHNYRHDDIDNNSLGNNSVYSLYKDKQGNIWVGTFSGGVDLFNKDANKFVSYKHNSSPQSLSNNNDWAFFEDSRKNLWVGTDGGGLELMDRKTGDFKHFRHNPLGKSGISGDYVLTVCEDAGNNLWVGTWGEGLTVIDKERNTFKKYKNNPGDTASLSGNNAFAIVEDKEKDIWVGTIGGGLNLYDRKKDGFRHFKHEATNPNSISSDRIQTLLGDSKNCLWIGTADGGLDLFDKRTNSFTHYLHDNNRNSLSNNFVYCLYEDSHENIWVGTADGLNLWNRNTGRFTAWFAKDGLPNSSIFGILEDAKGHLWISTNNGLCRFDPKTQNFKNFSVADGLQSNEFKAHSCLKTVSGAMYFGGVNGFNEFFPDSIKPNAFDPPLVITSFQIFNKEVPIAGNGASESPLKNDITETKTITLSYKQSVISFGFASLNFTIPDKKQYAYRLDGFDQKWNNIDIRRTATYTNLDPGEYVFEVKGLNNDGSWSSSVTSLELIITPPLWKTWWFKILAALSIAGAVIAIYRIRIGAIKKQKRELERQVEILDKAVAQGKFEIASDVLPDIGNAMVGFGSYLTRIRRLLDQEKPENLQKLADLFETRQTAMSTALGKDKANAVVTMLAGIAQTQISNLEEIKVSITEQLNIITHIQEILQIQRQYISGKETQERKPVNLRAIINDCLSMLFSTIDRSGIAVSLYLPDDLPVIKGDRTKLMQVILTVLKNSQEAIGPDAVEKLISIRTILSADLLIIEIVDSGKGFDEETGRQLFTRGFTTKSSGAGLGLYNCLAIMESHEGSITISSKGPEQGAITTIKFTLLPVEETASPSPAMGRQVSREHPFIQS